MKIYKKIFITFFIIALSTIMLCSPPEKDSENDNSNNVSSVADSLFSFPKSIATVPSGSSGRQLKISDNAKSTITPFFDYARGNTYIASILTEAVRDIIAEFEKSNLFDSKDSFDYTSDNGKEKMKWTVGNGEYFFEYWLKQSDGESFRKFMEIKFTKYINTDTQKEFAGYLVMDRYADPEVEQTKSNGEKTAKWVKTEFNSNKDGKNYLKVSIQDFLQPGMKPAENNQNLIVEAYKNADGSVEMVASISVPGINYLNAKKEYENRYYVYVAKGNDEKGTIKLGMPKDSYTPANVFDSENSIGGVIKEMFAEKLRMDSSNNWGADTSTEDIYEAFSNLVANPPDGTNQQTIDEWQYYLDLMSVHEIAYLTKASFEDSGKEAPTGHYTNEELPTNIIAQSEVDGLNLAFEKELTPGF